MNGLRVVRLALSLSLLVALVSSGRGRAECASTFALYGLELVAPEDGEWFVDPSLEARVDRILVYAYSSAELGAHLEAARE